MTNIVMIDANVLFKQNITDIIISLALQNLFEVRWTKQIESEWLQSKIKQRAKEKGEIKTQLSYFTNPPLSPQQYLNLLDGNGQGIPLVARTCGLEMQLSSSAGNGCS